MLADDLNAVRWQGKRQRGFYEVWYLTVVDPASGDAYWFRYTLDVPAAGHGEAESGLWAILTPKASPKTGLSLHDRLPLNKFGDKTTDEKGFRIEIAKASLEKNRAIGKVGTGERSVEWDLKWDVNGIGFEHVSPALSALGIAKSSVNSAQLAIELEGTIKVGGKPVKVSKWPGHQSHTWGTKHADTWAWAHCNAFAEDKTAVFEGVSARVKKLGLTLPPATPIFFRAAGQEHKWAGVGSVFGAPSRTGKHRWEFETEGESILLKGTVSAPPEKIISVEMRDPGDGAPLFVHHATAGDMTLEIYHRVGFRWELEKKLTSNGTTCFELAARERDMTVGRNLDLIDARLWTDEPEPVAKKPAPAPAPVKT